MTTKIATITGLANEKNTSGFSVRHSAHGASDLICRAESQDEGDFPTWNFRTLAGEVVSIESTDNKVVTMGNMAY